MRGFLVAVLAGVGSSACGAEAEPAPVVLVYEDASLPDAREIVTPGVLGLDLAVDGSGLTIRVVAPDDVEAIEDPDVVAVAIAPFTAPSGEVLERLGSSDIGVVSLSELVPSTSARPFVRSFEAQAAAVASVVPDGPVCAAGVDTTWAEAFAGALAPARVLDGGPAAVVTAADDHDCASLVWLGGDDGALAIGEMLPRVAPDAALVVGASARTPAFAADGSLAIEAAGVCACVDLGTTADPDGQAFVHAYAADHGLDAGPFAVEGYDAGRVLVAAAGVEPTRDTISTALASTDRYEGLGGAYVWTAGGDLEGPPVRIYQRVGLRWLEGPPARVAPSAARA